MKKWLKITLWVAGILIIGFVGLISVFIYKVKYGFPVSYETEAPELTIPSNKTSILLFSKTTGFRHGESIEAGKEVFADLAASKGWYLYPTEEGGVFNTDQLTQFDVVVFNNCTGRLLDDEQRLALQQYVEGGGKLVGIHGAGDDSHRWDWYTNNLLGTTFSHHAMDPQIQETRVMVEQTSDSLASASLPSQWTQSDEWYVFYDNPRAKGFNILCTINGDNIVSSGNVLWIKSKGFGMGADHPVAWYKEVGRGRTCYTSMGHHAAVWDQEPFVQMLVNFVGL
ncbi:MAG: ThuA domain-containing protein [Bacteroidota bacterium]